MFQQKGQMWQWRELKTEIGGQINWIWVCFVSIQNYRIPTIRTSIIRSNSQVWIMLLWKKTFKLHWQNRKIGGQLIMAIMVRFSFVWLGIVPEHTELAMVVEEPVRECNDLRLKTVGLITQTSIKHVVYFGQSNRNTEIKFLGPIWWFWLETWLWNRWVLKPMALQVDVKMSGNPNKMCIGDLKRNGSTINVIRKDASWRIHWQLFKWD